MSDTGGSSGQSSTTGVVPAVFAPSYLEIKGWCGFRDRNTHGLTEAQAREIITKLRQGIGPDLDSLIARVGAMRVRNTKIVCYLKTPSLSRCKQIREAMNAFIEKENIKLGPQGTTPFVTEEKPAWRQEQQRTFGKALGVAEQLATMKAKYITSEWYPFTKCMRMNRSLRNRFPFQRQHLEFRWQQLRVQNCWGSLLTSWSWLVGVVL